MKKTIGQLPARTVRVKGDGVKMQTFTALGLMSGTSLDGIDAALLQTDGERIRAFGQTHFVPFDETLREVIRQAAAVAPQMADREARPPVVAHAEAAITRAHIDAAMELIDRAGLRPDEIDVIGLHGVTLWHAPQRGLTIQIGDGQMLADATGIDTVYDFRKADMAAGGEGAPLVPVYHRALAAYFTLPRPVAFLNIGGVANLSWMGAGDELLAFDTGPGNGLIDDWIRTHSNATMDIDGAIALRGQVIEPALKAFMAHPYFSRKAPKSLDRHDFSVADLKDASLADGAATLSAFTAAAVAVALNQMPQRATRLVVCGGGAHNAAIMKALRQKTGIEVCTAAAIGADSDFIEAQAFAYLAVRHRENLASTFAATTGASAPVIAGRFCKSRAP